MQTDTRIKLSKADIEALPNFKQRTREEWSSACPVCGGEPSRDTDRFRYWPNEGNYWCRKCDLNGFISETSYFQITDEMRERWDAEQAERDKQEQQRKESALARLQRERKDLYYHRQLLNSEHHLDWLLGGWGITIDQVEEYRIGWCASCPTYRESDSYTIPFYHNGELINLRHRLLGNTDAGKYRPEIAGLDTTIFNLDVLGQPLDYVLLVEGEFKTIFLSRFFNVVGISGVNQFQPEWVQLFKVAKWVYVCFDPDAEITAIKTGKLLKTVARVKVVSLPHKPDDFFFTHGGTEKQFKTYLHNGRVL